MKTQTFLGNKPSFFLKQTIKDLENVHKGLSTDKEFLTQYFLNALPPHIRTPLLVVDTHDPEQLAKIADRLMANSNKLPTFVTHHPNIPLTTSSFEEQVSALTESIQSLKPSSHNPSQPISINTQPNHDSPPPHSTKTHQLPPLTCYHHKRFLSDSRTCCIGCSWPNPLPNIKILPSCIYHNIFGPRAQKCLPGCFSHFKDTPENKSFPNHLQKN